MGAALASVATAAPLAGESSSLLCWGGALSWSTCCDVHLFGPTGNPVCWDSRFTFEQCCSHTPGAAAHRGDYDKPAKAAHPDKSEDFAESEAAVEVTAVRPKLGSETFRTCWREGFNFFKCCSRDRPGGNPACWDAGLTYERCCLPSVSTPAAAKFEDVNCERRGDEAVEADHGGGAARPDASWQSLREKLAALVHMSDVGNLSATVEQVGGFATARRALRRHVARAAARSECPVGVVTVHAMVLFLCLAKAGQDKCRPDWAAVAAAIRHADLNLVTLLATSWPAHRIFQHISHMVHEQDPDCASAANGVDWPYLQEAAGSTDLPVEVSTKLMTMQRSSQLFMEPCEGGQQWVATVKMTWCAKTEVKCASAYEMFLSWTLRKAATSGSALHRWLAQAGAWYLFEWQSGFLASAMRHHYEVGLTSTELELLGVEMPMPRSPVACGTKKPGPADAVTIGFEDAETWLSERCRAICGWSYDKQGKPWNVYGPFKLQAGRSIINACLCAGHSAKPQALSCNSSADVPLYQMPLRRSQDELTAELIRVGAGGAPVLSRAAASVSALDAASPVFTTMVFGHMTRHLRAFANRVARLGMPNVVVFALDEDAEVACNEARNLFGKPDVCLPGAARTALQKYVVVLAYSSLGKDVFWFDFDSVWLKNPVPVLREAEATAKSARARSGEPLPLMYPAVDFDSVNCAMNAFFLLKACAESLAWLLALMHWIYMRPFAHDQLAFSLFLGFNPLVDQDPLPSPISSEPLDPNVFANAAKFAGLGFSSEVEELVLFHFFDGWNSNQPGEVEFYATKVYQQQNLFDILYGSDAAAARAAVAKSKLPQPATLKDCRFMDSLSLGVEVTDGGMVEIPPV